MFLDKDRNIWQGVATPSATFVVNKTGILSQIKSIINPHQVFVVSDPQQYYCHYLKKVSSYSWFAEMYTGNIYTGDTG